VKLIFDSLDALLAELRDRQVEVVRVSPAITREPLRATAGVPRLTSRVIVTAAIDAYLWAEWRHWVGRALAEVTERGLHLPEALRKKGDAALAEVSRRVDEAGFQVREGLIAHDSAVIDSFRL
jgi:hypothetical protein